jgi:hypothetical protein
MKKNKVTQKPDHKKRELKRNDDLTKSQKEKIQERLDKEYFK